MNEDDINDNMDMIFSIFNIDSVILGSMVKITSIKGTDEETAGVIIKKEHHHKTFKVISTIETINGNIYYLTTREYEVLL